MNVRPATRADLPRILEIYNDAVLTTTATYDYEPRTLEHRTAWFEDREKRGFPIFVAENSDGRITGWASLSPYHDRAGYRFTSENAIYVASTERGRGIGTLLLEALVAGAKRKGLRVIIAVIDAENTASIRLHEKFGFFEVGRFQKVGYKFKRWLDVVYMELLLDEPTQLD